MTRSGVRAGRMIFSRVENAHLPVEQIEQLARRYHIDMELMEAIVYDAHFFYVTAQWAEHFGGKDTIHNIDKLARPLMKLLSDELNRHRLTGALLDTNDDGIAGLEEVAASYETALEFLQRICNLTAKAHIPPKRGRPEGHDLAGAYASLARSWRAVKDTATFTNNWESADVGLVPAGSATSFLVDALRIIDPNRPRLAESLRNLMSNEISRRHKDLC